MAAPTYFRKLTHKSWYSPDYVASSVLAVSIETLLDSGIRHMILDIDDTLVPLRGNQLNAAYIRYFEQVRQAGIRLSIGSNTRRDITEIAESIGAAVISRPWWSYKPLTAFYSRILAQSEEPAASTVMIGDRVIQDIVGANRAGLVTILVVPLARRPGRLSRLYRKYLASH